MSENKVLKLLKQADWDAIVPNLLLHANYLARAKKWNTAQGLPRGLTTEDMVRDVIQKTLLAASQENPVKGTKGQRIWDPDACDLTHFLKEAIKSDMGHLAKSLENRKTNYNDKVNEEDLDEALEAQIEDENRQDMPSGPEELLVRAQSEVEDEKGFSAIWDELEKELKDDPEALEVLMAHRVLADETDIKNQDIAKELKVDIEKVRSTLKRIRRKARHIFEKHCGGGHE